MGSLASISNKNAGKGTVDEADNEIVDPNDVKETMDILQTENKQKNIEKMEGKEQRMSLNTKLLIQIMSRKLQI